MREEAWKKLKEVGYSIRYGEDHLNHILIGNSKYDIVRRENRTLCGVTASGEVNFKFNLCNKCALRVLVYHDGQLLLIRADDLDGMWQVNMAEQVKW